MNIRPMANVDVALSYRVARLSRPVRQHYRASRPYQKEENTLCRGTDMPGLGSIHRA